VASKALTRAAAAWGLTQAQLGQLVGLSDASISRLFRGEYQLDLASKSGQCALAMLRIYRSLDALVGGDDTKARGWLTAENHHLGGVPLALMSDVATLGEVLGYLDGMRGKI
jgi:transcriptional regulator with XRE-family HTH domain